MTTSRGFEADPLRSPCSAAGLMGVVVVNYASHRLLAAHLPSLRGAADMVVVVVDNWSSAAESQAVELLARHEGWTLVARAENVGFGSAVNVGVRRAQELGCTSVLLLNPDARVEPEVVAELLRHTTRHTDHVVSPTLKDSSGNVVFSGSKINWRTGALGQQGDVAWLSAACLAMSVDLFERLHGVEQRYFLYWEDVDLTIRAVRAGARLVVREDLVAVHDEGGTQGPSDGQRKSDAYYYYNCRNRLLFASLHLGRAGLASWVVCTPWQSWDILMRGGRRQLLHTRGPLWSAMRGSVAGVGIVIRSVGSSIRSRSLNVG